MDELEKKIKKLIDEIFGEFISQETKDLILKISNQK
jgi:hypothetical protein